MSRLPSDATIDDVEDELMFARVLLASLDPDADTYEPRKQELEATIQELENRVNILLPMRQGSASDQIPQDVGYQDPEDLSTAHSFDPFNFDFGGDGAFDDGTAWDESGLPSNSVPLEGGTMNLPSLGNDTSAASSVITSASSDQGSSESLLPPVNSLKRPHPSSSSQAGPSQQGSSKLRRMTPSPAATYPSTPTSLDSLEVAEQGFAQQHGSVLGNGNAVASRALMRQRLAEEAASKRRQSQLRDAQLAQALHQELHPERPQSTYRSPQTYLNPDG
ncbi:hypothetical protein LTR04_003667, partial [Oleoguttula sp. CCFEE 6159]